MEKVKNVGKIYKAIARKMPGLRDKLLRADIHDTPEYFLKKVIMISFFVTFTLCFLFLLPFFNAMDLPEIIPILAFPILFPIIFAYLMKLPDMKARKIEKEITRELLFAIRFLIVELESGIMIFNSFENIRRTYPAIGKYFGEVIDLVDYGMNMDEAINTVVNKCPSEKLRLVFVQIQNSMKTGTDTVSALTSTVEQFTAEEKIEVDEYAKKLNPIAMFYMIVAVIFPSIGFMMLIIISSFIGLNINLKVLFFLSFMLGFVQFMFVSMIKSIRPPVDF